MLLPPSFRAEIARDGGKLRCVLIGKSAGLPRFDAVVVPKALRPDAACFGQTEKFSLYYEGRSVPQSRPESRIREKLMTLVVDVVRRLEGELSDSAGQAIRARCDFPAAAPRRSLADELSGEIWSESANERILRITFACCQNCAFCFVRLDGRPVSLDFLKARLAEFARKTRSRPILTLSGGEPAADSRLWEILRLARDRGFRKFRLQSNAVPLRREGFVPKLLKNGVKDFFISFHSHKPELYDRITRSRGQYPMAVQGIENLMRGADSRVFFSIVLNRLNYQELPAHVGFLGRMAARFRKPVGIFLSLMNQPGHRKAPDFALDLAAARSYLNSALRTCRNLPVEINAFSGDCAIPPCTLDHPEDLASPDSFGSGDVRYLETLSSSDDQAGRVKALGCRRCALDANCRGVPPAYACLFGLSSLVAVPRLSETGRSVTTAITKRW
ncbi:MAG: radical SAM protein [Elusimicrobiota bacterium]